MTDLPSGTVTFLFTDIEGSTRLWESSPDAMRPALARHDQLLRQSIQDHCGYVFKTVGDAFCAAFPTALDALNATLAAQQALAAEPWPDLVSVRVRMALHTGSVQERDGDYFGPPLNRVARLLAAAHGGQALLSLAAQELTRDALPPPASLLDLGERRLKDLGRPERVFQLLHPGLRADFPPLRSLESVPNNLPQQMTSFIGREREIGAVKALLGKTRLLTLTGAGGSGKTRLSLQAAADALDQFPDGIWLAELAPLADPALVPQAVASALGVKEQAGQPLQKTLVDWLRDKRLLLALDNCEHLVGACAALAADLLRSCPNVHILATSREPLNIAGEQTYRVLSLSSPDPKATQTVEALSQYEAVRLFIERAQAVHPAFSVTDKNAPAVAQVCFHLDGIPLAIELAAARVRSLPVDQINTRLDQRFRLLTGGARNVLPRQQTLRALVDWSYDLLTEPEKTLLRRVSVFAGGWTLGAAEAVCAGDDVEEWEVLDLLTGLVDKSLVVYEEEEGRYRLLETVRQYGQERLAEGGEADAARDVHLSWCMAFAEEANSHLSDPEQGTWLSRLETEHDNLRAALAWAGEPSADMGATRGLRLAGALGRFWFVRGHWSEGHEHLRAALAQEEGEDDTQERAKALGHLGFFIRQRGDRESARLHHEQALEMSRRIRDQNGEMTSLARLANLKYGQGDLKASNMLLEQTLALARQSEKKEYEAVTLTRLGDLKGIQGQWEAARMYYEQSLAILRQIGHRSGESGTINSLGFMKQAQGEWAAAQAFYEQSLAICREVGNRIGEFTNLTMLGALAREQGDFTRSRSLLAESLMLKRQFDSASSDFYILYIVEEWAALALAEGVPPRAARLAGAAQAGREAINEHVLPEQQATHERTLSAAHAALGEEAFTAAWDAGRAMTLEQAVDYAQSDV